MSFTCWVTLWRSVPFRATTQLSHAHSTARFRRIESGRTLLHLAVVHFLQRAHRQQRRKCKKNRLHRERQSNVWALSLWELPLVQIVGTVGTVRVGSLESEQPACPRTARGRIYRRSHCCCDHSHVRRVRRHRFESIGREEWRTKLTLASYLAAAVPQQCALLRYAVLCTRCLVQDALHGIHIGMLNGIA